MLAGEAADSANGGRKWQPEPLPSWRLSSLVVFGIVLRVFSLSAAPAPHERGHQSRKRNQQTRHTGNPANGAPMQKRVDVHLREHGRDHIVEGRSRSQSASRLGRAGRLGSLLDRGGYRLLTGFPNGPRVSGGQRLSDGCSGVMRSFIQRPARLPRDQRQLAVYSTGNATTIVIGVNSQTTVPPRPAFQT